MAGRRTAARGFTLLELMAVMFLIALATTMVSFALGGNDGQRLRSDARTFANQTAMVVQESLLANQLWGLQLYRSEQDAGEQVRWRWMRLQESGWEAAPPPGLAAGGDFGNGVTAVLTMEGREVTLGRLPDGDDEGRPPAQPEIWLAPGDATPFSLALQRDDDAGVVVALDVLGRVVLDSGGEGVLDDAAL